MLCRRIKFEVLFCFAMKVWETWWQGADDNHPLSQSITAVIIKSRMCQTEFFIVFYNVPITMSRALCLVLEFDHLCALLARCEDIFTQLPSDILQSQYLYTAAKCFYRVNTFTQLRSDILQSRWVRHFTQEDWRCNICRGTTGKQISVHIWK